MRLCVWNIRLRWSEHTDDGDEEDPVAFETKASVTAVARPETEADDRYECSSYFLLRVLN